MSNVVLSLVVEHSGIETEGTGCHDDSHETSFTISTTLTPDLISSSETLVGKEQSFFSGMQICPVPTEAYGGLTSIVQKQQRPKLQSLLSPSLSASMPLGFTHANTAPPSLESPSSEYLENRPLLGNKGALVLFKELSLDQQMSLQNYRDLFDRYFQAMMRGQVIQGADIKNLMSKHFDNLNTALDENKILQGSILEMQQRMHEMQKQTLDRLATIHNRIQAVFTQTFELHEYPIPRLFIVLPKPSRRRDKFGAPFAKQFRLYFLCECGEHTRINGSKISHEVHLAKHDGYDLNKPTEFFHKYGDYILAMMQMIKFGFTAAGIVVPALTDFKIVEGLGTIQKGLELGKSTIGALVDETIGCIEDKQSDVGARIESADDRLGLDQQEVLEGADLRQLEAYLDVQDEGRTLGNLYRTVTSEGHVKWVCMDHFRATYRDKIMEPLKRFVSGHGGVFHEELGIVEKVDLTSQGQAEDLYEAIATARGISRMAFKLSWDASHGELRMLRKAMDKANVMDLAIEGIAFKKAVLNAAILSRRYQPILELMSNRRVQSLHLKGFDQFYLRLGKTPTVSAPQLRVLSIDAQSDFNSPIMQPSFDQILRGCPSLAELSVISENFDDLFRFFKDNLSRFKSLRTLTIQSPVGLDLITGFSKMQPFSVHAVIYYYPRIKSHLAFLLQGHLTELTVREVSRCEAEIEPLCQTIAANPNLITITIGGEAELYPSLISRFESTRESRHSEGRALNPCRLQLNSDGCDNGYGDSIVMDVDFTDAATPTDVSIDLTMGAATSACSTKLKELFFKYGWAFQSLITNSTFMDLHATHLSKRTCQRSKLTTLTLNPFSLTGEGISSMDRAIYGFTNLQKLSLHFEGLHDEIQLGTAVQLLKWYGMQLEGLVLSGEEPATWLKKIESTIPSREAVPKMKTFSIIGSTEKELSSEQVHWIATMISRLDIISAPELSNNPSSCVTANDPLETIVLSAISISAEDWDVIFKALDFTTIVTLSFDSTDFSQENFSQLLRCLPEDDADISLRFISLLATKYAESPCPTLEKALKARSKGVVLTLS
ncbi:hypothetical protein BGZ70_001338 [Mortierella alpina]|uniref:Uncharacterized protein n=1 Tax=Mortierella alpina TaxID=64518 RepID=A0A9P6LY18_MORAP|nr:hypothetical protein BGZ70_001338 [Mortierella alpina]